MFLAPAAPVDKKEESFAKHWEFNALKYQPYFEIKRIQALANIHNLRNSSFANSDPIKIRSRMTAADTVHLRQ